MDDYEELDDGGALEIVWPPEMDGGNSLRAYRRRIAGESKEEQR